MAKKSKAKKSKTVLLVIIALAVVLCGGLLVYMAGLSAVDKNDKAEVVVSIPNGSGASAIVEILDDNGLVNNKLAAKINAKIGGYNSLQANSYVFSKSMSFTEMMKAINTGDFDYISKEGFEMKEGMTIAENAELMAQQLPFTKDEIIAQWADEAYLKELINDYWFLTDDILQDGILFPLEGYLFPDTYYVTIENPSIDVLTRMMLDRTDSVLSERKDAIESSQFSIHEFLTLASIVCKEGGSNDAEAPTIAGVFINRLNEGMNLGSDVTVNYAIQEDKVDLRQSELNIDSKYNTRKNPGLPIGPICATPTVDLDAVLNYEKTDYLFFYAGPDGTIYYAKTNEEHSKNVEEHPWSEEDLAN